MSELVQLQLKQTLGARLRRYLLAGVLVSAPIASTVYLVWAFVRVVDRRVEPLIPRALNPESYLPEALRPIGIPGLGVVIALVALICVGWLAGRLTGRFLLRQSERLLGAVPGVRSIYMAFKQISSAVLVPEAGFAREVVLFEYPRNGCWALGFVTGVTRGQVQELTEDEVVNVFLPTTPNPTSGFLLFLKRRELTRLDMSVEEGVKMIISGGIVTPDRSKNDTSRGDRS